MEKGNVEKRNRKNKEGKRRQEAGKQEETKNISMQEAGKGKQKEKRRRKQKAGNKERLKCWVLMSQVRPELCVKSIKCSSNSHVMLVGTSLCGDGVLLVL